MVVKCGHTFCKKCILEKNLNIKKSSTYGACPLDNIENIFDIESCIINLRVELLIKKIFYNISQTQSNEQNINQKQIVYSKPDIKKTKNITNNNQNIINKIMLLSMRLLILYPYLKKKVFVMLVSKKMSMNYLQRIMYQIKIKIHY